MTDIRNEFSVTITGTALDTFLVTPKILLSLVCRETVRFTSGRYRVVLESVKKEGETRDISGATVLTRAALMPWSSAGLLHFLWFFRQHSEVPDWVKGQCILIFSGATFLNQDTEEIGMLGLAFHQGQWQGLFCPLSKDFPPDGVVVVCLHKQE